MTAAYADTVTKIKYAYFLRKNILQKAAVNQSISFENVPVLEYIRQNPGCMQADIAKKLKQSAAAITLSTQKLEGIGMIEKRIDTENLRRKKMYITEKGIKMIEDGKKAFDQTDIIMFRNVSEKELSELNTLLDKINTNMESAQMPDGFNERHLPWEFSDK